MWIKVFFLLSATFHKQAVISSDVNTKLLIIAQLHAQKVLNGEQQKWLEFRNKRKEFVKQVSVLLNKNGHNIEESQICFSVVAQVLKENFVVLMLTYQHSQQQLLDVPAHVMETIC